MSIIYRVTDKVKVNIDDIEIKISPLTYLQKQEVQELMQKAVTEGNMKYAMEGTICAIKYSLKSIKGIKTRDGEEYELELEDKKVSDNCIDDLLNMKYSQKISAVCTSLVNGVGTQFVIDPNTNEPLEGVKFEDDEEKK